jgi:hypothetical protein
MDCAPPAVVAKELGTQRSPDFSRPVPAFTGSIALLYAAHAHFTRARELEVFTFNGWATGSRGNTRTNSAFAE